MANNTENNRNLKQLSLARRAYKLRQSGHDWTWIAHKLGIEEVKIRQLVMA